jgi:hypothetical protein
MSSPLTRTGATAQSLVTVNLLTVKHMMTAPTFVDSSSDMGVVMEVESEFVGKAFAAKGAMERMLGARLRGGGTCLATKALLPVLLLVMPI